MPASRCAPGWTKRNIPKASRFPISRWLPSTLPATRSMATGTIRFHLIEKIIVQNELTELFMDEPLVGLLDAAAMHRTPNAGAAVIFARRDHAVLTSHRTLQ